MHYKAIILVYAINFVHNATYSVCNTVGSTNERDISKYRGSKTARQRETTELDCLDLKKAADLSCLLRRARTSEKILY